MDLLKAVLIECPYCGETIEVVIDCSVSRQEYIEDCGVCCKPMVISVKVAEGGLPRVEAWQEDE
jgi:hypothetical protein